MNYRLQRAPVFFKELNITVVLVLFLFFSLLLSSAVPSQVYCKSASSPGALLKQADKQRKALYGSAKKKKFRHHWFNCINRYRKISKRYPKADEAVWAMYHSAQLYTGMYAYSGLMKDLDESLRL